MTAGIAVPSCSRKRCPPSNSANRALRIAPARNSLLAGGARPSKRPPQTNVGHAMLPSRAAVSCCARAASWFASPGLSAPCSRPPRASRFAIRATGSGWAARQAPSQRVSSSYILRAALGSSSSVASSCRGYEAPPAPPGRGAGQDEATHPPGMPHRQLLGHHAAEGHAHDEAVVPADRRRGAPPRRRRNRPWWRARPARSSARGRAARRGAVGRRRPGAVGQPRLGCAGHHAPGHALTVPTAGPFPAGATPCSVRHAAFLQWVTPDEPRRDACCSKV